MAVATHIEIFSPRGRIGRLRFLGYILVLNVALGGLLLLAFLLSALLIGLLEDTGALISGVLAGLVVVAMLALVIIWAIKRCHDFNASGWWSLLALVPLAGLVFCFIPGNEGENRFGPPPPENGAGIILAVILPLGGFIPASGILAAIAIPAYNSYQETARQAEAARMEHARERQPGFELQRESTQR